MAGAKGKASSARMTAATPTQHQSPMKTSTLVKDPNIGYKIRALLYDFRNVRTDRTSEGRISMTTDPLYISNPHFTEDEAARIKAAIVDTYTEMENESDAENPDYEEEVAPTSEPQTVEDMLHAKLARFLEKRNASGDFRPCGPHDMAPIYESVFGISRKELEDENFLRRLRKSGLQTDNKQNKSEVPVGGKKKRNAGK